MRDLTSIAPHRRQTLMCFTKPGTRHNRSLVTDRSICSFFVLLFPARMVKNKFRTFLAHALFRLLAQTGAPQGRRNAPGRMAPRHGSWLTRCSECWRRRALRKGGARASLAAPRRSLCPCLPAKRSNARKLHTGKRFFHHNPIALPARLEASSRACALSSCALGRLRSKGTDPYVA
jgi:hypothetical protein